jgi:hypothetical protein
MTELLQFIVGLALLTTAVALGYHAGEHAAAERYRRAIALSNTRARQAEDRYWMRAG